MEKHDKSACNTSIKQQFIHEHTITEIKNPTARIRQFVIKAPHIAARHKPGHFVIVRATDECERIPLTIADSDPVNGTITLIVQAVGASTERICRLSVGDAFKDVAGPLGLATEIEKYGHVVLVGGGVGTAVLFPQAKALKAMGNRVSVVTGGRSRDFLIMEKELTELCDAVYPCTDDGSYGYHGFVTGRLKDLIATSQIPIDRVITAGPLMMMKAIADITREHSIATVASLVTIMVDGTGMCGGCRVTVGGEQRFACVHGPEFDAHKVDFREITERLRAYRVHEKVALVRTQVEGKNHKCKLEAAVNALSSKEGALPTGMAARGGATVVQ